MSPPTCTFPHAPTPPPPSTWSQSTTLSSLCYTATFHAHILTSPDGASGKESAYQYRRCRRHRFYPWVGKMPWRRAWQPTPVFFPGESHGQRSLAGHSPWGRQSQACLRGPSMQAMHIFSAALSGRPTLSCPHCVHKTALHICISILVL